MLTPEERKASQRRRGKIFLERHPEKRHKKKPQILKLYTPPPQQFCTYELADPRDELRLPRFVSWSLASSNPVWKHAWDVREYSCGRWAAWFRELDLLGLFPVEISGWAIGKNAPINPRLAHKLVRLRVIYICQMAGCVPDWLLNNITWNGPTGRKLFDGTIEHFLSSAATRKNHSVLWTHSGKLDSEGSLWWED
jgi:hypothetical protein